MLCPKCGFTIPDGIKMCSNCGAALNEQMHPSSQGMAPTIPEESVPGSGFSTAVPEQNSSVTNYIPDAMSPVIPESGMNGEMMRSVEAPAKSMVPVIIAIGGIILAVFMVILFAVIIPQSKKSGSGTSLTAAEITAGKASAKSSCTSVANIAKNFISTFYAKTGQNYIAAADRADMDDGKGPSTLSDYLLSQMPELNNDGHKVTITVSDGWLLSVEYQESIFKAVWSSTGGQQDAAETSALAAGDNGIAIIFSSGGLSEAELVNKKGSVKNKCSSIENHVMTYLSQYVSKKGSVYYNASERIDMGTGKGEITLEEYVVSMMPELNTVDHRAQVIISGGMIVSVEYQEGIFYAMWSSGTGQDDTIVADPLTKSDYGFKLIFN